MALYFVVLRLDILCAEDYCEWSITLARLKELDESMEVLVGEVQFSHAL